MPVADGVFDRAAIARIQMFVASGNFPTDAEYVRVARGFKAAGVQGFEAGTSAQARAFLHDDHVGGWGLPTSRRYPPAAAGR